MDYLCIACTEIVTSHQHALKCDGCDKWQHGKCKAGDNGMALQERFDDEMALEMSAHTRLDYWA